MKLDRLQLANFRNYERLDWQPEARVNLLVGANAQGKTNLLEAIALLARGRSERVRNRTDIIKHGTSSCKVAGDFRDDQGLAHELSLRLDSVGARELTLDGQKLQRVSQLYEFVPCIFQESTDLELLLGAPALRRSFLDMLCLELSVRHLTRYTSWQRLLRSRNALLARGRSGRELGVVSEQLARVSAVLVCSRLEALEMLNQALRELPEDPATEKLEVDYRLSGASAGGPEGLRAEELESWYRERLAARQEEDLRTRTTGLGPHRDELAIKLDGWPVRRTASRGQLKDVTLRLRLAEWRAVHTGRREPPLLLLDDVFSETDHERRRRMLGWLPRTAQLICTGTDPTIRKEFDFEECREYRVTRGSIGAIQ
jgi:DNA replication and repair protein RecF